MMSLQKNCFWCVAFALLAGNAGAQPASSWQPRAGLAAPTTDLAFGFGPSAGRYEYVAPKADGRRRLPAMLLTPVQRNDYVFFSSQEEAALLLLRERATTAAAPVPRVAAPVRRRASALHGGAAHVAWPRVVVRDEGKTVCVPEIAFAADAAWESHLTCVQMASGVSR